MVLQQEPCAVDIPEGTIWNEDCLLLCVLFWIVALFSPVFGSVRCCYSGLSLFIHEMSNVSLKL